MVEESLLMLPFKPFAKNEGLKLDMLHLTYIKKMG